MNFYRINFDVRIGLDWQAPDCRTVLIHGNQRDAQNYLKLCMRRVRFAGDRRATAVRILKVENVARQVLR